MTTRCALILALATLTGCAALTDGVDYRVEQRHGVMIYIARSEAVAANLCAQRGASAPLLTAQAMQQGRLFAPTSCASLPPHPRPWIVVEEGDQIALAHELGHALRGERHYGDGGPDR